MHSVQAVSLRDTASFLWGPRKFLIFGERSNRGRPKSHSDFFATSELRRRAAYGNRTRLLGLGSRCTTDVLMPQNFLQRYKKNRNYTKKNAEKWFFRVFYINCYYQFYCCTCFVKFVPLWLVIFLKFQSFIYRLSTRYLPVKKSSDYSSRTLYLLRFFSILTRARAVGVRCNQNRIKGLNLRFKTFSVLCRHPLEIRKLQKITQKFVYVKKKQ